MSVNTLQSAGSLDGWLQAEVMQPRQKAADNAASRSATTDNAAEKGVATAEADKMRSRADESRFSSKMWSPSGQTDFSMSTYTKNGTLVQVEAGERSFTMGNFQNAGLNGATNRFHLAGARDDLNMQVIFTTADGNSKAFKLTETSTFHETDGGEIVEGRGRSSASKDPNDPDKMRDENNIIINMDDDGVLTGGDGDDILINFGENARVQGNEGNDNLISMADKVTLDGGLGDDLIKIVDDVMRKPKESTIDFGSLNYTETVAGSSGGLMDLLPEALVGSDKGTEATILGGDGNDVIDARNAKLERATVKGGNGDDLMMLDVLAASSVNGGDGNDTIEVQDALMSTIDGGKGDDAISLDRGKDVTLKGGAGDDAITADFMVGGAIFGGEGNDTITVNRTVNTHMDGGNGDDTVKVGTMVGGTLLGGNGNDTLLVDQVENGGVIAGGAGNDTIGVGDARSSEILGGEGDDTIGVVADTDTRIQGGEGNNTIVTGSNATAILSGGKLDTRV